MCLALFDAGLFAAQVANQSTALALDPVAPARLNSACTVVYFVGVSLGTMLGAVVVESLGWTETASVAAGAIGVAFAVVLTRRTPPAGETPAAPDLTGAATPHVG